MREDQCIRARQVPQEDPAGVDGRGGAGGDQVELSSDTMQAYSAAERRERLDERKRSGGADVAGVEQSVGSTTPAIVSAKPFGRAPPVRSRKSSSSVLGFFESGNGIRAP